MNPRGELKSPKDFSKVIGATCKRTAMKAIPRSISSRGFTLVGDWVHVRRKFHDVIKASDKSVKALLANLRSQKLQRYIPLKLKQKVRLQLSSYSFSKKRRGR